MNLPFCHSRRFFENEDKKFFCAHPQMHAKGQIVRAEICRMCSYWQQPPPAEYRPFSTQPAPQRRGPCEYLGEQVGLRECPSCRGVVQLKVFACSHPQHSETTLRQCRTCVDFRDNARSVRDPQGRAD